MYFEWDEATSDENLAAREFDFAFASLIFQGPTLDRAAPDGRRGAGSSPREGATTVSAKTGGNPQEAERPQRGRANFARLRAQTEEEIMATSPPELADLPDDFWDEAVMVYPEPKEPISLRVDREVLSWFRDQGPGYQTRMNVVLRSYMEARTRK